MFYDAASRWRMLQTCSAECRLKTSVLIQFVSFIRLHLLRVIYLVFSPLLCFSPLRQQFSPEYIQRDTQDKFNLQNVIDIAIKMRMFAYLRLTKFLKICQPV